MPVVALDAHNARFAVQSSDAGGAVIDVVALNVAALPKSAEDAARAVVKAMRR